MKTKSANDLYIQTINLTQTIAERAFNEAIDKGTWNENPKYLARLELVNNILKRYTDNILKHFGRNDYLSNEEFCQPVTRTIYADF